jgi:hypothetical protein
MSVWVEPALARKAAPPENAGVCPMWRLRRAPGHHCISMGLPWETLSAKREPFSNGPGDY